MRLTSKIITFLVLLILISSFIGKKNRKFTNKTVLYDTIKKDSILVDSSVVATPYKTNAHASYYHDKFTGRRTASGAIFDNAKFTAAHKKLKFGTKVRVTNIGNSKSVIVTITDRGPFTKGREIDLSKAAFKSIARNNQVGVMTVNLEIIE